MSRKSMMYVWTASTLAVLILLIIYARGTITALLLALTIAYILEPVVDALERRRIPRGLAILLLAAGIVVGASALVLWIVPRVVEQARQFVMSIDLDALKARGLWGTKDNHTPGRTTPSLASASAADEKPHRTDHIVPSIVPRG